MGYPPLPGDKKQYPDSWFPAIATREIPKDDSVKQVDEAPVAVHGDSDDDTAESLGAPKKMSMGALRVWIEGGSRKSRAYDDGPDFDYGKAGIEKPEAEGEESFNFAPGTDEGSLSIRWQVFGLANIKSAKLELFARGMSKPVWEHHWGNAWGKQNAAISDFADKTSEHDSVSARGELPFSAVALDTGAQATGPTGQSAAAFPAGKLTVARSPYQLRLTVSGCSAAGNPADGDKLVYPMTAWSHCHVLIAGFEYKFGDKAWLKARDDIDPAFKDLIAGKGATKGLEELVIENLRGFVRGADSGVEKMDKATVHRIALQAEHNKGWGDDEHVLFKNIWGKGPRIPLIATATIKKLDGSPTADHAADVLNGAGVMWDWEEPDADRIDKLIAATPTIGGGSRSAEFLKKVTKDSAEQFWPTGSFNCPKEHGGKHGDDAALHFDAGPDKYKHTPCSKRKSSVVTVFDGTGESGVIFWPSRFAGDAYRLKSYLYDAELDKKEPLADPPVAVGSPGVFEVHRKVSVHHLVIGTLPGIDVAALRDDLKRQGSLQANLHIDLVAPDLTHDTFMKEVRKNLIKNTTCGGLYHFHALEFPHLLSLAKGPALLQVPKQDDYKAAINDLFKRGAIRQIKPIAIDANFGRSVSAVGGTSKATGCLVDFGSVNATGGKVFYAISDPGKAAFSNGETVTDPYTDKTYTVTYDQDLKSCWRVEYQVDKSRTDKSVRVQIGAQPAVDIAFRPKGIKRSVATELADDMKSRLKSSFDAAVNALADGETLTVKLQTATESDSGNAKTRADNVKAELELLAATRVIQRCKVLDELATMDPTSTFFPNSKGGVGQLLFSGASSLFGMLAHAIAYTYVKQAKVTEGLVVVHASRFSSFTDHDDAKGTKNGQDFTDYPTGAFFTKGGDSKIGLDEDGLKKVSLIYLVTPQPDAPSTFQARPTKKPWAIMLHEMGHGYWLNHAQATRAGQTAAPSPMPAEHVEGEACLMSYDAESDQLCAICMLRLRGWDWSAWADNKPPELPPRKVSIKMGDVNSMFPHFGRTVEGKRERLQMLGLFLRPLGLEEDAHAEFVNEFKEAWEYSWRLAKELWPRVDTNPEEVLAERIKEFIVEGGEIPAADKEAKLRVFGHYHPYYSNMDVAMRYGNSQKKDSRENQFKMNAKVGDIQGMVLGANVALGTIPLMITVTDDSGTPLPSTDVWIRLIKPKDPLKPFNADFAGQAVLGATSFIEGTAAPKLETPEHNHVKKWLQAKIVGHQPSPDTDPQKGNVHYDLGGKRLMQPAGDVVTEKDGIPNLFVGGHVPIDEFQSPVRHAVRVTTDDAGVARLLFKPSVVGGDSYRLEVLVREGTGNKARTVGRCETGNMVVWRTMRIAGYYQRPNVRDAESLPAELQPHTRRYTDTTSLFTALSSFNLRKSVGVELARSYIEVLFERDALGPQPLPGDFERNVDEAMRLYKDKPMELYSMLGSGNGGPRVRLQNTSGRIFEGTIPVKVRPWHVAVAPVMTYDLTNRFVTVIAHIDPNSADTDEKVKLVTPGKYVWSYDEDLALEAFVLKNSSASFEYSSSVHDGKTMVPKLKVTAASEYDYKTGKIKVVLDADVPPNGPAVMLGTKEKFGEGYVVTGATIANTDDGALYVRTTKAVKGTWDVCFYKESSMKPEALVAATRRVKAGKKKVTARPENASGITVKFDFGNDPLDQLASRLSTGLFVLNAIYLPQNLIDRNALLARDVTRSPWLMNFVTPEVYNQSRVSGYPDAPPARFFNTSTWWDEAVGEKRDFAFCETVLLRSMVAGLRKQGICYYPGQFYVQSNYMNPIQGGGLRGKGVGNVAFLFTQAITRPEMLHYLVLHETGHCLYGVHAPDEDGRIAEFHDDDLAYRCIMAGAGNLESTKPEAEKNLGTFCGKCNAGLRGINVMEPPLFAGTKTLKPGDSKTGRRPKVLAPTGGLTVPDSGDVDPHPTPPKKVDDQVVVVVDAPSVLSDDDIVCDIAFVPQKKSLWCWAASSQIMRKFYKAEEIEQEALAREATGNENDQEYALPLVGLDCDASGEGTALSFDVIKQQIDDDKPFIFGNSRHYMVCYGYRDDAAKTVIIWDPLPVGRGAKRTMTYAEYKAAIETGEDGRRGANYSNIRVRG